MSFLINQINRNLNTNYKFVQKKKNIKFAYIYTITKV